MFLTFDLEIEMAAFIPMGRARPEMPAGNAKIEAAGLAMGPAEALSSAHPIYNGLYPEVLMSFIRYLMLLSLVIWIGGLIFFAFVLAPTVFAVLPTRQLAGNVVNRSLGIMHWMAISCGVVFAVTSMIDSRIVNGVADPFAARNLLIYAMIILTLVGMFGIASRMLVLRQQMGVIDDVPQDDARRVEFNRLHVWSTRIEGSVLVLGLALLFLTARRMT